MKAAFSVALAVLLVATPLFQTTRGVCFALWDIVPVTKDQANDLGLEVRTKAAGRNRVSVELEFKTEGTFGAFGPDGKFKDSSGVQLWIGERDNPLLTAPLREDQSKPGRVVVAFHADREHLDQINLRVMAPFQDGGAGGTHYELRVKDFVEPEAADQPKGAPKKRDEKPIPARPTPQAATTDRERMIGNWFIMNDDSQRQGEMWVITEDSILMHAKDGGANSVHYAHRLDASKNPKQRPDRRRDQGDLRPRWGRVAAVPRRNGQGSAGGVSRKAKTRRCAGPPARQIGRHATHGEELKNSQPAQKVLAPEEAIQQRDKENITFTIERKVRFGSRAQERQPQAVVEDAPPVRVARLMALAIRFDGLIRSGH